MPVQPWNLDKIIADIDEFLDAVLDAAGLDLDYEIREGGGDSAELISPAEKVVKSGRPFHFQPMTSRERRIIHLTLRNNSEVMTTSEGMAPGRHTVIYKADKR